jgi:hypothetical protein
MEPCTRPGEDPNAWKQFGPEPEPGDRASVQASWAARDSGFALGQKRPTICIGTYFYTHVSNLNMAC